MQLSVLFVPYFGAFVDLNTHNTTASCVNEHSHSVPHLSLVLSAATGSAETSTNSTVLLGHRLPSSACLLSLLPPPHRSPPMPYHLPLFFSSPPYSSPCSPTPCPSPSLTLSSFLVFFLFFSNATSSSTTPGANQLFQPSKGISQSAACTNQTVSYTLRTVCQARGWQSGAYFKCLQPQSTRKQANRRYMSAQSVQPPLLLVLAW